MIENKTFELPKLQKGQSKSNNVIEDSSDSEGDLEMTPKRAENKRLTRLIRKNLLEVTNNDHPNKISEWLMKRADVTPDQTPKNSNPFMNKEHDNRIDLIGIVKKSVAKERLRVHGWTMVTAALFQLLVEKSIKRRKKIVNETTVQMVEKYCTDFILKSCKKELMTLYNE